MDKEMLTCARKIKNYCIKHRCEDCVFYRFGYCALDHNIPGLWVIARKKVENNEKL